MGKIGLDYGEKGINVEIPEGYETWLLTMKDARPIDDPQDTIRENLFSPKTAQDLENLCRKAKTACIVVSDKTRPVPNKVILPPILEILDSFSINTKIIIACGMHSPTLDEDLKYILGEQIIGKYSVVNHDPYDDDNLLYLGETKAGIPIRVNRVYCQSDIKILTGLIEPHFMAGFSGGRKSICPGISGIEAIKYSHSAKILESPLSKSGALQGNPCNEFMFEVAKKTGCHLMINVALNSKKQITGVFCGDMKTAYFEGVKFCEENAK